MSAAPLDIDSSLALRRRSVTAPTLAPRFKAHAFASGLLRRFHRLPRPSWIVLMCAVAAAAALVWWTMLQRLPQIDPAAVIATNLTAAERALNDGLYVEPPERSAAHHYVAVLALDPDNVDALNGLDLIAQRYLDSAKTLIANGRIADGVIALEHVRRIHPDHQRLRVFDAQLRRELDTLAFTRAPNPPTKVDALRRAAESPRQAAKLAPAPRRTAPPTAAAPSIVSVSSSAQVRASGVMPPIEVATSSFEPAYSATDAAPDMQAIAAPDPGEFPEPSFDVGGNIDDATAGSTLLKYVRPTYPQAALSRGVEGWVDLSLSVSPSGAVSDAQVLDGEGRRLFERSALAAVRQWRYEPRANDPAGRRVQVRVTFQLED